MSQPFIGEIQIFGFNFAPKGWAMCNGQILQINQNQALFSLLGTTYGGNGQTTFALPDLRSRAPMHFGSGTGQTFNLGQQSGQEAVTLTSTQLPAHTHSAVATTSNADTPTPTGAALATASSKIYGAASNSVALASSAIASTGGSQPHANLQPLLALNFCIALVGIFPSRN